MDSLKSHNVEENKRVNDCMNAAKLLGDELYRDRSDLNNMLHFKLSANTHIYSENNNMKKRVYINNKEMPKDMCGYFAKLQECENRYSGSEISTTMFKQLNRSKFLGVTLGWDKSKDDALRIEYSYDLKA